MASERVEVITRAERRRRWSPADKLRLVLATREPGVTVASVAREHGVSESLLYAWRGRLPPSRIVGSAGATAAGGFVPLPSATIEIELPNGCRLRVHERIAAGTLRKVVAVLGSVRPRC